MALTYGFFDSVYDSDTGIYDRSYNAGTFTDYFGQILGSGVCVYNNDDSMLVSVDENVVTIAPGYLFLNGYWLKNSEDYVISFSEVGTGTYAIVARLDLTSRLFLLTYEEIASSYTNALVLAYVTVSSGGSLSVVDTRADTTICGEIDAIGSLSSKVAEALDYIDNSVPSAFRNYENQLTAWENDVDSALSTLERTVDSKIDEVDSTIEKLPKSKIGEIRYSAVSPGTDWLQCDGSLLSAADYPDLAEALNKVLPGKLSWLVYEGSSQTGISNVLPYKMDEYGYYLFFYSHSESKIIRLYSTQSVMFQDNYCSVVAGSQSAQEALDNLVTSVPITLSLANGYYFLTQLRSTGTASSTTLTLLRAAYAASGTLTFDMAITADMSGITVYGQRQYTIPYVVWSSTESLYYMSVGAEDHYTSGSGSIRYNYPLSVKYISWNASGSSVDAHSLDLSASAYQGTATYQRNGGLSKFCFNSRYNGEMVGVYIRQDTSLNYYYYSKIISVPSGLYNTSETQYYKENGTLTSSSEYHSSSVVCTSSAIGNGTIITDAALSGNTLTLRTANLSTGVTAYVEVTSIIFPANSKLFPDTFTFLSGKNLWFLFVGTGFVFTSDITDASAFGFMATTDVLGTITNNASVAVGDTENFIVVCGQNTSNVVLAARIDTSELPYGGTGTYLPNLTAGGVPAYIKAVEG